MSLTAARPLWLSGTCLGSKRLFSEAETDHFYDRPLFRGRLLCAIPPEGVVCETFPSVLPADLRDGDVGEEEARIHISAS